MYKRALNNVKKCKQRPKLPSVRFLFVQTSSEIRIHFAFDIVDGYQLFVKHTLFVSSETKALVTIMKMTMFNTL